MIEAMNPKWCVPALLLGVLIPVNTLGCEIATTPGTSVPQLIGHQAMIVTSNGQSYSCKVESFRTFHTAWDLKCTNGASIGIGIEVDCADGKEGLCTAAFVRDRNGQVFRMQQDLDEGWSAPTCDNGIASRTFKLRLSQEAFMFDAIVTERFRQKTIKPPAGF
jgi:hypothetical protein